MKINRCGALGTRATQRSKRTAEELGHVQLLHGGLGHAVASGTRRRRKKKKERKKRKEERRRKKRKEEEERRRRKKKKKEEE